MVYQWKTQGLYKIPAEVAASEIAQCTDADGYIQAAGVVERARPQESPLHPVFEWRDNLAAEKWREQQARVMIANIVTVETIEVSDENVTVRAFAHVGSDTQRGYKAIAEVLGSAPLYISLLETAKRELASFRDKYRTLLKLRPVTNAISKFLEMEDDPADGDAAQ
jgi:hypothetical protein